MAQDACQRGRSLSQIGDSRCLLSALKFLCLEIMQDAEAFKLSIVIEGSRNRKLSHLKCSGHGIHRFVAPLLRSIDLAL